MTWNATPLSDWRLYVIVDRETAGPRDVEAIAEAAVRGGADVVQWRDKRSPARQCLETGKRLLALTRPAKIPLIINDRVDIAMVLDADGVHLGQTDLPAREARAMLGPDRLIGVSTHSLEQAAAAEAAGADYIGFGPVFATPTKPEYGCIGLDAVAAAHAQVRIPIVCIGGIDLRALPQVVSAGGRCIAVVRAVCAAPDPEASTRALKAALAQYDRARRPAGL